MGNNAWAANVEYRRLLNGKHRQNYQFFDLQKNKVIRVYSLVGVKNYELLYSCSGFLFDVLVKEYDRSICTDSIMYPCVFLARSDAQRRERIFFQRIDLVLSISWT
jgi:hypothetical protein